MMYNKNSNDSTQFSHQVPPTPDTNNINLNNTHAPKSQISQDVSMNLNKEDLVQLFNAFMRAATGRGVININGGIHVHIDKIVDVNKVNK